MQDLALIGTYIAAFIMGLVELFFEEYRCSHFASVPFMIFAIGNLLIILSIYEAIHKYAPSRLGYELDLFIKQGIQRYRYLERRYGALWA